MQAPPSRDAAVGCQASESNKKNCLIIPISLTPSKQTPFLSRVAVQSHASVAPEAGRVGQVLWPHLLRLISRLVFRGPASRTTLRPERPPSCRRDLPPCLLQSPRAVKVKRVFFSGQTSTRLFTAAEDEDKEEEKWLQRDFHVTERTGHQITAEKNRSARK